MTHSTHGPSTPAGEAVYDQSAPATTDDSDNSGRAGVPVPPQPVFQRPAGYDTLSPASPYTVVFEPWPDTSSTSHGTAAAEPVPSAEPVPAIPAPAFGDAERVPWAAPGEPVGETTPTAPGLSEPEPAPSGEPSTQDGPEPPLAVRPYATSFIAAPQQPEPALLGEAPDDGTQPYVADPQPYAAATQPYIAVTEPYVAATQPYAPAPQPMGVPSFVPSPYGGPASPQPYAGSSNTEPDPYFSLLRPHSAPPQFGSARPRTENVGRGLAMALLAVLGGCVLSAFVYHLGFVASIVALGMGAAGIYLYAKGAGAPPRKGAVALVALLIAGILLAWVSSVGTELYLYYVDRTGTSAGALAFALESVLSLDLFKAMLKDFLMFVGFGLLGIFGVARQLLARRAR